MVLKVNAAKKIWFWLVCLPYSIEERKLMVNVDKLKKI
jgi:hypothetical protein